MKTKQINLLSGTEEGWHCYLCAKTTEDGRINNRGTTFHLKDLNGVYQREKMKRGIRISDKRWVYQYIPSSIWWFTELHHDWKDGGRMYLLTKGEHILRHRKEKEERKNG